MVNQKYQEKVFGKEMIEYFLLNCLENIMTQRLKNTYSQILSKTQKGWVGNFNDSNYDEWKYKMQRLTHIFEQEVTPLLSDFKTEGKELFTVPKGSHPKLLKEYLGKRVSAETMVILDKIMDYSSKWDTQMEDDMIWLR